MRSEEEIREQYEFLEEPIESEEMRHERIREPFTFLTARSDGCSRRNTYRISDRCR